MKVKKVSSKQRQSFLKRPVFIKTVRFLTKHRQDGQNKRSLAVTVGFKPISNSFNWVKTPITMIKQLKMGDFWKWYNVIGRFPPFRQDFLNRELPYYLQCYVENNFSCMSWQSCYMFLKCNQIPKVWSFHLILLFLMYPEWKTSHFVQGIEDWNQRLPRMGPIFGY